MSLGCQPEVTLALLPWLCAQTLSKTTAILASHHDKHEAISGPSCSSVMFWVARRKIDLNKDTVKYVASFKSASSSHHIWKLRRTAFHWDNFALEKSAMVRPLGDAEHGGVCEWEWSGSFTLSARLHAILASDRLLFNGGPTLM